MKNRTGLPRVLLVEDDPVSRAFLAAAVQSIPTEVDAAESLASALVLAAGPAYDLWLLDARLPDGTGDGLLADLRSRHPGVPAIAHTASTDAGDHQRLLAAGFREVLVKPLTAGMLQQAIGLTLGLCHDTASLISQADGLPVWDDDAAANALNGNRSHIQTLRGMFLAELPQTRQRVLEAVVEGRHESLRSDLHKLRASCGFVGAARLGTIVHAMEQALGDGPGSAGQTSRLRGDIVALTGQFDHATRETLDAHAPGGIAENAGQPDASGA